MAKHRMLDNFQKLYAHMPCQEKRDMYRQFIERIDVLPETHTDVIADTVNDDVPELLKRYKERIGAATLDDCQVLRARGFLLRHNGGRAIDERSSSSFCKE